MKNLNVPSSLVSVSWLEKHMQAPDLIILDATIPKLGQDPDEAYTGKRIKGSRFMDLKQDFCKRDSDFPNTAPEPEKFQEAARKLGIGQESCIVVYDVHGIYSAPRAWWLFRAMGYDNVAVLDGGLPAWIKAGLPLADPESYAGERGDFTVHYRPGLLRDYKYVLESLGDPSVQIIDARSEGRFNASVPEPRVGMRGGHIPGSSNIPIKKVLADESMMSAEELKKTFTAAEAVEKELVFSCGSGVTACVLALAADQAGYQHLSVFDGSWTEWASRKELPVEK